MSPSTWGLLGLLRLHKGQLALEPITLLRDTLVHVTLDPMVVATRSPALPLPTEKEADEPEDALDVDEESASSSSPLGRLLSRTAEHLAYVSEGGLRAVHDVETLRKLASQVNVARPDHGVFGQSCA